MILLMFIPPTTNHSHSHLIQTQVKNRHLQDPPIIIFVFNSVKLV